VARPMTSTVKAPTNRAPRPSASDEELVTLRDLSVRYRLRRGPLTNESVDILAVDRVDLAIRRGQTLGLVGGTGSGKSTIAQVIMGMVQPTSGSAMVGGVDVWAVHGRERTTLRRRVQVVMQDPYSSLDPRQRVGRIIAEPLTLGRPIVTAARRRAVNERVAELLSLVGLSPALASRYPHQFSGGQRQRIAIARALAPEPELIVLDEPTSALDVSVRAQILTLLRHLQDQLGLTYLFISHDLISVAYLAHTVAVMQQGRIVESGPTKALYKGPRHPYTLELLDSAPGASGAFLTQPRPVAGREALSREACRFAGRCALRIRLGDPEACRASDPILGPIGDTHRARCHFPEHVAAVAEAVITAAEHAGS
jgi:oligopeptide transport system ATP-binding protein